MLSINSALFIHLAIFLVVVLLCAPILIKPTLSLLEERSERIAGARNKARSMQEQSDSMVSNIEERLTKTRREAIKEREQKRIEFAQKADSAIAEARQKALDRIAAMRKRIAAERESAKKTLSAEADALSREIARRVLGREVA